MTFTGPSNPIGVPTGTFPWRLETYSNITPFTVRDGETYLNELLQLKDWLATQLVPYVDSEITAYVAAFNNALQQVNNAFDGIQTYVTSAETSYDSKVAAFDAAVTAANSSISALVAGVQAKADAAAASAATAAGWASTTYNIQDANVATLTGTASSQTHAALTAFLNAYFTANGREVNVKTFGAIGDGIADDTAAFTNAFASLSATAGGKVIVPSGLYLVSSEILMNKPRLHLEGAGRGATQILTNSPTNNGIHVGPLAAFNSITRLSIINKNAAPTAGAGIFWEGGGDYTLIEGVYVENFYTGFSLHSMPWGTILNCVAKSCMADGFLIQNDASGTCQWQMDTVLSETNGGNGFHFKSVDSFGVGGITAGNMRNLATYANTGNGFRVEGTTATPISDVRVQDSFFGQDVTAEMYFDSYGRNHVLDNVFTESCGMTSTGPQRLGPKTEIGYGLFFTANNQDVTINGGKDSQNAQSGIYTYAQNVIVCGRSIQHNGLAADTRYQFHCGIYVGAGNVTVTGCSIFGQTTCIGTTVDTVCVVGNSLVSAGSAFIDPVGVAFSSSVRGPNRQTTS